jgi:membrane-associated phospholipid phosphatase
MKSVSHIISFIFHPLFLPAYAVLITIQANPSLFDFSGIDRNMLLVQVVINTIILPAITIGLMIPLGFVKSLKMEETTDRILPYIAGMFYYIWIVVLFIKGGETPVIINVLMLGALISMILSFLITLVYAKISLHTVGAGILVGYFLTINSIMELNMVPVVLISIFLAGLIGTSRLILKAHTKEEIYLGYFIGSLGLLISINFLL